VLNNNIGLSLSLTVSEIRPLIA